MTFKGSSSSAEAQPALPTAQAQPTKPSTASRINRWFERHWLLAFNGGWAVFVTLPWLAPVLMALGLTWPGRAVYFMYNFFCHQLPERSWFLFGERFSYTQAEIATAWGRPLYDISSELVRRHFIGTPEMGWKVAWSDRMVAMYTSILLFGLVYAFLRERGFRFRGISWWWFLIFILPLALDGTTHLINDVLRLDFRQTNEWAMVLTGNIFPRAFYVDDMFGSLNSLLRIISGILFGFGVVAFMWPMMDNEFAPNTPAHFSRVKS
jgi:uncharacterized membrane protein